MRAAFVTADISYEEAFRGPTFAFLPNHVELLSALYESLSPRVPLTSENLEAHGANKLSDVSVRVHAMNGHANMMVTPDHWVAELKGVSTDEDVDLARDLFHLTQKPLKRLLPENAVLTRTLRCLAHVEVEDASFDPLAFLEKMVQPDSRISGADFSVPSVAYGLGISLGDPESGRITRLQIESSFRADAHLFISLADFFSDKPDWADAAALFDSSRVTFERLLAKYAIEIGTA